MLNVLKTTIYLKMKAESFWKNIPSMFVIWYTDDEIFFRKVSAFIYLIKF